MAGYLVKSVVLRTARVIFQLMGGLGAGLAIIFSLLAWQLSKGPVSLGFLTEHLERALNNSYPKFNLKIGDTILTWAGWQRALDIRVLDVTVSLPDGRGIGSVPEAWFSLSGDALLEGKIEPRTIEFYGPRLSVRRDRVGTVDIGFGNAGTNAGTEVLARGFLDQFKGGKKLGESMGHLSRVAIIGGAVTIRDEMLKRTWNLPVADIRIDRLNEGFRGEINLLLDQNGKTTELVGGGVYRFRDSRVSLNFNFTNVEPALFSDLSNYLPPLKALNMPISGTLEIAFPIDGEVKEIRADIKGTGGKLVLFEPQRQELDVISTKLKAKFHAGIGIELESFDAVFAEGTKIILPNPISHAEPLRRLSVSGRLDENGRILELKKIIADLNGPVLNLSAKLSDSGDQSDSKRYRVNGEIKRVATDSFRHHWPESIFPMPRKWIDEHISGGFVEDLSFDADVKVELGGKFELVSISGGMKVRDAIVNYLPPNMPSVKNISAEMRFDESTFSIDVEAGKSEKLELVSGRIVITGLDQVDQFADIDLKIKGGVQDKLAYINHKPFRFSSELGLDLKNAEGDADTRLKLFFILEKEISFKQIRLWARAKLIGVRLGNLFHGYGIDHGNLNLRLDNHGVDVKGNVEIDKIPAKVIWRHNFAKRADFISKYRLTAEIKDIQRLRDMGLSMDLLSSKYIQGEVKPNISYTVFDEENHRLEVTVDITDTALSVPAFGWSKKIGTHGEASMVVDLENKLIVDVPAFSIQAADLNIQGKANYALDGSGLERLDFARVSIGRTEMKGALIPKHGGGWEAGFHGPVFDLSPLWEDIKAEDNATNVDHPFLDRLTVVAEFKKVWLDDRQVLHEVSGTFVRADNLWQTVLMSSRVGDDATFDLQIQPRPDGKRNFSMHAFNAGEVFKILDLYPNMIGGKLRIKGVYDDAHPGQPLKGNVVVDDYRIINAPALAHVISIMSLTGILEALQGQGLVFTKLDIPFEFSQGVFRLKDAKATGTSLGFTASGKVFRHADIIDLEGTVVPAYLINSAFGRIPVLGSLLTGGEKGGGVFAATYTMAGPMEEPVVSVNPLSALTPGFLRKVFGIFSDSVTERFNSGGNVLAPSPE